MTRPGDFDHLYSAEVRLEQPSSPRATFVLDDRLSEEYQTMTQEEFMKASAMRLQHSSSHVIISSTQPNRALYGSTIKFRLMVRAQQALTQHTHAEVKALISLDHKNCTAVPKLLGYGNRVQGVEDYVPGGNTNYLAWKRVAGEPIGSVSYWERDLADREEVRSAFRAAYK
ncbi:hypothetical protein N7447_011086 [Penicillium robsamsonii]|uniref:uncharacterized protein n=1 Tax=Penicillium robsamsonii TaxID=1792511 RepID=UPI00254831FB|nr:uncharacterized protein N7447_011086 [Penicillium robsamsonii]KAJ5807630.1 hypothetical protein N7447_011086 [Penicillium robsamsonii]